MTSEIWVHNLDPFAIQFPETFWVSGIRWYGLAYLAGFFFASYLTLYMAKKGTTPLQKDWVGDFITFGAIGTLIGGRLGYVFFYSPDLLTKFTSQFPYWGLIEVHKGGMASHGGIIGVMIACWLFGRMYNIPWLHILDLTTLGGSLGFFFGRIANFVNGELYGRPAPEDFSWAVKFPSEIYRWGIEQSEKLKQLGPAVEALGSVKTAGGRVLEANSDTWNAWINSWSQYNISVFKEQLVLATQRGNERVIDAIAPALTARYPSQIYQSLMEGLLVFIILAFLWRRPRKPGFIAACFGIVYAVMRILGEQYRMPDAHIGFEAFGLTRGQWLSAALLVAGLLLLAYVRKQDERRMGGWGLPQ